MWSMIFFDLPVAEPEQRKAAGRFRNFLCRQGFYLFQESVYLRWDHSVAALQSSIREIERQIPQEGNVCIFLLPERQMQTGMHFVQGKKCSMPQKPSPFLII